MFNQATNGKRMPMNWTWWLKHVETPFLLVEPCEIMWTPNSWLKAQGLFAWVTMFSCLILFESQFRHFLGFWNPVKAAGKMAPTFSARRQPPPTSSPPFPHVQLWTSGLHPGWLRVPIPQVVGSARLYQDQLRVRKDQPGINSKVPENGHELTCSVDLGCPAHQAS